MNASPGERLNGFREGVGKQISRIELILERKELIPEANGIASKRRTIPTPKDLGEAVFIVHSHDNEAKLSVARFVKKWTVR